MYSRANKHSMKVLTLTPQHTHARLQCSCKTLSASFGNSIISSKHQGFHRCHLVSMAVLLCLSVLWCAFAVASTITLADLDYGGVPLWIDRLLGEPSVLSLRGRLDVAWYRANNPQACPQQCDCPIQWPTALYCDHRGLADVPEHLPARTQYLFLQRNNISSLTSSFLANITGLHWLILDHNRLRSDQLDQGILQNQSQLVHLFANHNNLSSVPNNLPDGLKQLRLAYNQISSIGPDAFKNLKNLTLLLLQGNILKTIKEGELRGTGVFLILLTGVFIIWVLGPWEVQTLRHFIPLSMDTCVSGLVNLNLLDLGGNSFSSVPKHLPTYVQQLYLSKNPLSGLDEDSFLGFSNLQYLRLSHCNLKNGNVHPQAFNLSTLVELDLSYNKFTSIPEVPITLQHLYLEANEIKEFNLTSFCREVGRLTYSRLKSLRLDGNELSYRHLPSDWVFCLRVIQDIFI
ncbi:lumican isoform X1 [Syngnathus scovelli]|uniref:lumican isoform X1 n=1 Tax=Syngnathus scovelli TaxID=161590 RepID=UPI002110C282|nr:lumican isoform X1 [Syngnathus scovelli]